MLTMFCNEVKVFFFFLHGFMVKIHNLYILVRGFGRKKLADKYFFGWLKIEQIYKSFCLPLLLA